MSNTNAETLRAHEETPRLSADEVRLIAATPAVSPLLENLLELYTHDLSDVFPQVVLGTDGRFGYPHLAEYWEVPATRYAYLIWCADRIAGFALVIGTHETGYDVAEFFVLKQFRRTRVGRRAAHLLWSAHPGRWTVRVSVRNVGALGFWTSAIADAGLSASPVTTGDWHVFTFTRD